MDFANVNDFDEVEITERDNQYVGICWKLQLVGGNSSTLAYMSDMRVVLEVMM